VPVKQVAHGLPLMDKGRGESVASQGRGAYLATGHHPAGHRLENGLDPP
jgi:hypothetical protein